VNAYGVHGNPIEVGAREELCNSYYLSRLVKVDL